MKDFSKQTWEDEIHNAVEMSLLLKNMPIVFSKALSYLMKYYRISNEELSEHSGLSISTIKRLKSHDYEPVTFKTFMSVCIGLKLNYFISTELLKRAPINLVFSEKHMLYRSLLSQCHDMTYEEALIFLDCIEQEKNST